MCEVVKHGGQAVHLVQQPVRHGAEKLVIHVNRIGRHAVYGIHWTQNNGIRRQSGPEDEGAYRGDYAAP